MATAIVDSVNPHSLDLSSEPSVFTPAVDSNTDSSQTEVSAPSSSLSSDAARNGQPSKTKDEPQNAQLNETNEAGPPLQNTEGDSIDSWPVRYWNSLSTMVEQRPHTTYPIRKASGSTSRRLTTAHRALLRL